MPAFHFNVYSKAGVIVDIEGIDLPDLASARAEAISDIRALMSEAILRGHDVSGRHLEITDMDGALLMTIAFVEAIDERE